MIKKKTFENLECHWRNLKPRKCSSRRCSSFKFCKRDFVWLVVLLQLYLGDAKMSRFLFFVTRKAISPVHIACAMSYVMLQLFRAFAFEINRICQLDFAKPETSPSTRRFALGGQPDFGWGDFLPRTPMLGGFVKILRWIAPSPSASC